MLEVSVASENALIVYLDGASSTQISEHVSSRVMRLQSLLAESIGHLVIDFVPSYASLLIEFDIFQTDHRAIRDAVLTLVGKLDMDERQDKSVIELPVFYDESVGPDLNRIAEHHGISVDEVMTIHQQNIYQVYAVGFSPGFAYLGSVDDRIAMPRLATPRKSVPAGSVAIADRQTAIYPSASPGGWNIIGHCPTPLFSLTDKSIMSLNHGDKVTFYAINHATYLSLRSSYD